VIGLAATRRPVRRIQQLVLATTTVAHGDYGNRVAVSRPDEIGQLEYHFNQMAEQLAQGTAERQVLIEQNARLAERARISRDLHDSVKQQLFAVAMQLGVVLSKVEATDAGAEVRREWAPLHEHLVEADTLVSQAQRDLTALIHQWRPTALQNQGLASALQIYATAWCHQHQMEVDLQLVRDGAPLPPAVEEAFWHIAQEALANIVRHSQAMRVSIQLQLAPQAVTLIVEDDGCGFMNTPDTYSSGVGLHSMRERMAELEGSLSIVSSPGAGTRIMARCPLVA
jgi:NarL family two-component system sensor histidine kinase LiaS